jgi:ABC-type Co2+ transport system permease subunit
MHIEPGFVAPFKVAAANAGAIGLVAWAAKEHLRDFVKAPWMAGKTLAAAVFFSLFMQSFHMPVGPSELHFVGAMAIYLTFGFVPTLLGFGLGLALQGLLFEPKDLVHLGVNSLSLMLPLIAVHYAQGRKLFAGSVAERLSWKRIVGLDAQYYAGVTGMVGFWLFIGESPTAFADWLAFASSYLAVVAIEPLVSLAAVHGLKKFENLPLVANLTTVRDLRVAA